MIRTEKIQSLLFRMFHDPGFADSFLRGRSAERTALSPRESALFAALDPRRLRPLPDDKVRRQTLGNLLAEYPLSFHSAPAGADLPDSLLGFFATPEFHAAIDLGKALPLCFADYWQARAETADAEHRALCKLEVEIVRTRRQGGNRQPGTGLRLAPTVRLIVLPEGTLDLAESLRQDLEAGRAPSAEGRRLGQEKERVMLQRRPAVSSFAEALVKVEKLEEALAGLLFLAAEQTLGDGIGLRYAQRLGATEDDYDALVGQLIDEEILVRR